MKTILIISFALSFFPPLWGGQEGLPAMQDSLKVGSYYEVQISDNVTITGKLTKQDSTWIYIKKEDEVYRLPIAAVLSIEPCINCEEEELNTYKVEDKLKESSTNFDIGAGIGLIMNRFGYGLHSGVLHKFNGNFGLRPDLTYGRFPEREETGLFGGSQTDPGLTVLDAGIDFLAGKLVQNQTDYYFIVRLSFTYWKEDASEYYDYYSGTTVTFEHDAQKFFTLGIGGGLAFPVSKKSSLFVELHSPMIIAADGFEGIGFIGGIGIADLKAGVRFKL